MIPEELIKIKNYLNKENFKLKNTFEDGRLNASINEDQILKLIRKEYEINIPKSRSWFDFSIETENIFYPVNIKVTNTTHQDNLNCKLGIYYSLTGHLPDFPNEIRWLHYFEKLKNNLGKNKSKDYFFLVINKSDLTDVFVNSLKGLNSIYPNGNNLPFQCKWADNKMFKKRKFKDSQDFLLKTFGESIKLRSEIYFNFKKYFKEYV